MDKYKVSKQKGCKAINSLKICAESVNYGWFCSSLAEALGLKSQAREGGRWDFPWLKSTARLNQCCGQEATTGGLRQRARAGLLLLKLFSELPLSMCRSSTNFLQAFPTLLLIVFSQLYPDCTRLGFTMSLSLSHYDKGPRSRWLVNNKLVSHSSWMAEGHDQGASRAGFSSA